MPRAVLASLWCTACVLAGSGVGARPGLAQPLCTQGLGPAEHEQLARDALLLVVARPPADPRFPSPIDRRVEIVQPAFRVGAEGLAITRWAALRGAAALEAELLGSAERRAVLVLGLDPASDLALLRISERATAKGAPPPDATASERGLELAPSDASPLEDEARTLHVDAHSGATAVLATSAATAPARRGTLGGSPIVDGRGRLLGLWDWSFPSSSALPSITSLRSIAELVGQHARAEPIPPSQLAEARAAPLSRSLPFLRFARAESRDPLAEVVQRGNELERELLCAACGGKGEFTNPGKKSVSPEGGVGRASPARTGPCPVCRSNGLRLESDQWSRLRILASKVARLDLADAGLRESARRALEESVGRAVRAGRISFLERTNAQAAAALRPEELVAGRALCLSIPEAEWKRSVEVPGERPARALSTQLFGDLLLCGPGASDALAEGRTALVFGVVAGFVSTPSAPSGRCAVLERCLVVPLADRPRDKRP